MFEGIKKFFAPEAVKSIYADLGQRGQPQWSVQDDEAYIKEAFERVVWVYACVTKIASCVSSIPWVLYRKDDVVENHSLVDLFNDRVNPFFTSQEYFEMWAVYLAVQGKFYTLLDNPANPAMLTPLKPHKMKITPTKDGSQDSYIQSYTYDELHNYSPNLIMDSRFFDPLDFYDGLSPIRAGARTIDTENSAVEWNKDVFDNMGVPPGMIQVQNPSPETIKDLKARWKRDYAGPKNARVPAIMDSEKLNYINFGMSQIDMDFIQQRKLSRIEICALFGVPGQVVGDPEGQTYANYSEAEKTFWNDTVIKRYLNKMQQTLNMYIVKKYDPNLQIRMDVSGIEVLQEDEAAKSEKTKGLFVDNIITQNEARIEAGYDPVDGGDVFNYELAMPDMGDEDIDDGEGNDENSDD